MIGFMLLIVLISCDSNPTKLESVTGVSLNHTSLTLEVGMSETLIATVEPSKAKNHGIIWSSSDEEIATVSENGEVTAISEGDVIIKVTTIDGSFEAECVIKAVERIRFTVANADQWNEAINFIRENGDDQIYEINVTSDFSLSGSLDPTFGNVINVSVRINGNHIITLISEGHLLYVNSHQNVIINDTIFEGQDVNVYRLIMVVGIEAIFTMDGNASVRNNHSGGGISVQSNATFNLLSGSISGNSLIGYGPGSISTGAGVILVWDTIFNMSGGTISGNYFLDYTMPTHDRGGGVSNLGGIFTMTGGEITGNIAEEGAGVDNSSTATFIMSGGAIYGHTEGYGSGVLSSGIFILSGGLIYENYNGGVIAIGNNVFQMSGGKISGNLGGTGSGVSARNFTMTGGEISENISRNTGGGVYITTNGTFKMSGGTIFGNSARRDGGVLLSNNVSFIFSGGIIYGNEESGAPANLANKSETTGASLGIISLDMTGIMYGDGSAILLHIDGTYGYTDDTLVGKQWHIQRKLHWRIQ